MRLPNNGLGTLVVGVGLSQWEEQANVPLSSEFHLRQMPFFTFLSPGNPRVTYLSSRTIASPKEFEGWVVRSVWRSPSCNVVVNMAILDFSSAPSTSRESFLHRVGKFFSVSPLFYRTDARWVKCFLGQQFLAKFSKKRNSSLSKF
ncbi:hypothetical protein DM860_015159 [Cuscuta australis]|uniref:Uncharacterized protein n=1 Tax=Cuscuta australis TaxID=267555 RepID=A0A328DGA6_9ASTE|nr:hypothetical protein DM860_015159 [Cuscuta australis]